jgi:biopolymer transport protein ExbD
LFRNTPISLTDLTRQLTARFDPTQRLVLRVDKDVDFERVEQLMRAAGAIGFEKMSFDLKK